MEEKRIKRLIFTSLMIIVILLSQVQLSQAQASGLVITPITWNVIGLDSNKVSTGPDTFPVGARVCNNGTTPVTNLVSNFVWDSTNAYIDLVSGSPSSITAASLSAGGCVDFYYNVRITRTSAAYDTARRYHITVTAGGETLSTPTPRELYVEHLVSQNRNSVGTITGPTTVFVGQTYTYIVTSSTATQGYEQLESFLNFPNIIFRINSVSVTYTAGPPTGTTLYADACLWHNDPTLPNYRSCTNSNKAGGNLVTTYTVTILSAGRATMSPLIYDFSGSSYHYNDDFGLPVNSITVNAYDPPTIAKSFSPNPVTVGFPSTLTFTLTNPNTAGQPPLTGVAFTDNLPSTPGQMVVANPPAASTSGCGTPTFAPLAGSTILTFSGGTLTAGVPCIVKVNVTVPAAGSYLNTTSALTPGGAPASDTLVAEVPAQFSLNLAKAGQLDMTVVPPPNIANAGDRVNYTLTATNTGNRALTGVSISDPLLGTLACTPGQPATLAPGASLTCTASHTLTQANIDAGVVNNTATADSNETSPTTASASVVIPASPGLSLVKTATPTAYDAVGEVISYSYTLTNTGNVTLLGPFTVSDNRATATCPATATLAPEATITCTASYTITQADLDAGSLTNTASASGGGVTSNTAQATVTATQTPQLVLTKTPLLDMTVVAPSTRADAGDRITYTFSVQNTGNVTLHDISVTDPLLPSLVCTITSLAPGATASCTPSGNVYTLTQGDIDAGLVNNTALASCLGPQDQPVSDTDQKSVPLPQSPALTLVKSVTSTGPYNSVGNVITYQLLATNTGNITLHNVSISDPKLGALTCTQPVTLAPGATLTCTGSHTVTQPDLDAGSYNNIATASSNEAAPATGNVTVPIMQVPHLSITKSATPLSFNAVGQTINYTIVATNDGNITLNNVTITDPLVSGLTCTPTNGSSLAPAASMTCTATHVITQADLDAGLYANMACVDDGAGGATPACASTAIPAIPSPALTIVKTATPATYSAVDAVISYSYLLTNSGNVTLSGPFTVTDNKATVTCPATAMLAPGASITCTATYTITLADLNAGSVTNSATGHGFFNASPVDSNPDSETVTAVLTPALTLVKTAAETTFSAVGEILHFTVTASNTGNVTLTAVTISDLQLGTLTCTPAQPATLVPGASLVCNGTHSVTQADLDAGSYHNVASATATSPSGPVTAPPAEITVPAVQSSGLSLVKTATPATYSAVGNVISYSYLLRNSGNVTLSGPFTVTDDKVSVTCPATVTLAPGAFITCTASYSITQADLNAGSVTNVATGHGFFGATPLVSNSDTKTVIAVQGPALTLVKAAAETSFSAVGDILHFTITATNTGNVTLGVVMISDPQLPALSCTPAQPTNLVPGAALVCTGSHTVTQADLDAGSYLNTTSATASPPTGPVLDPTDEITVPAAQTLSISLQKSAAPVIFDAVGQAITYSYLITNTGNVTLPGPITVTDNKTTVTCNPVPPGGLLPQATLNCSATYLITQADLTNKSVTNVATASANGATSNQVNATIQRRELPAQLPGTGFAPGRTTLLSAQPANLEYAVLGDLWLEIPALHVKASIVGVPIAQDSWQLDWLGSQVGYLEGTAFPTWKGNSVLTAHVYDANGLPGPFLDLGKMRWGQQVIIHAWGQSYIYEIRSVQNWVNPDNTSIITHEEKSWLTLITCQGYDEVSDSYHWRIVARAVLVKVK